jgi:hypothetical protein
MRLMVFSPLPNAFIALQVKTAVSDLMVLRMANVDTLPFPLSSCWIYKKIRIQYFKNN